MAGQLTDAESLNNSLSSIVSILNDNNINDWFICYGTLLGIVRSNSCIDDDDDVDIMINVNEYDNIKGILKKLHAPIGEHKPNEIIQIIRSTITSQIDIYFYKEEGNKFIDKWNDVVWNGCKQDNEFILYRWNDIILKLPHNAESKLKCRYGDWTIKSSNKTGGHSPNNLS